MTRTAADWQYIRLIRRAAFVLLLFGTSAGLISAQEAAHPPLQLVDANGKALGIIMSAESDYVLIAISVPPNTPDDVVFLIYDPLSPNGASAFRHINSGGSSEQIFFTGDGCQGTAMTSVPSSPTARFIFVERSRFLWLSDPNPPSASFAVRSSLFGDGRCSSVSPQSMNGFRLERSVDLAVGYTPPFRVVQSKSRGRPVGRP